VLILGEPTTGLDPRSRVDLWQHIEDLVAGGTTILLTTQYLEEADRLAHWIVVIDTGRVIAQGTPGQLKDQIGGAVIDLQVTDPAQLEVATAVLAGLGDGRPQTDPVSGGRRCPPRAARRRCWRWRAAFTTPASSSTASGCGGPHSTTSSWR
jgi:ABC-type multidrug transport system ATPase subunit